MNLEKMAFEFIERLLKEDNLKKASINLWAIAKENRMRSMTKKLWRLYRDAEYLELMPSGDKVDDLFVDAQRKSLRHELDLALEAISHKDDLKIPFSENMKFSYRFDEKELTKEEKQLVYDQISTIRDMGFQVMVNKAS